MRNYYVYICEINGKPMFLQRAQKGDWVIKKRVLVGRKKICKIIGTSESVNGKILSHCYKI